MYIAAVNYINSKSLFLSLLFFQLRNCDHYNRCMGMIFSKYCFRNNSAPIAKFCLHAVLEQQTKNFLHPWNNKQKNCYSPGTTNKSSTTVSENNLSPLSITNQIKERLYLSILIYSHMAYITLLHCKVQAAAFF